MPSIPSNKPYRVGRSPTGLGLFATKPIKKGTKIIRYFGPLLDSKKKKDDAIENKYLFELNDRWTIEVQTPVGAVLDITRSMPAQLDAVMQLH